MPYIIFIGIKAYIEYVRYDVQGKISSEESDAIYHVRRIKTIALFRTPHFLDFVHHPLSQKKKKTEYRTSH